MSTSLTRWFSPLVITGLLALSIAFLSSACGGDGGDGGDTNAGGERLSGGAGGAAPVTIVVSMAESGEVAAGVAVNFFEPKQFTVSPGQNVTFNLTNDGAAIHNLRIAGEDGQYNTDDDTVSEPAQVSSGETGTIDWTAPDEAGTFEFRCDFHPTDMVGTVTVESPSG
jgi:plastocyanin